MAEAERTAELADLFKGECGPPEKWLRQSLASDIAEFEGFAGRRRRAAFGLRISAVIFGAATTVAIGTQSLKVVDNYKDEFSIAALVLSAFVVVVNAWEAFFDFRWDWIRFKETYARLLGLLYELNYANSMSPKLPEPMRKSISERHIDTIVSVNLQWAARRIAPPEDKTNVQPAGKSGGPT